MSSALTPVANHKSGDQKLGVTTLDFLMSKDGEDAGIRMRFERQGFGSLVTTWSGKTDKFASALLASVDVSATLRRIGFDDCVTVYDQGSMKGAEIRGDATFSLPHQFYDEVYSLVCASPQTAA